MEDFYKKNRSPFSQGRTWLFRIVTLTVFLCVGEIMAQTVTGAVSSAEDGMPLPGVTIMEKGTNNGVTTDFDGLYSITIQSENPVLEFSYLGFVSQISLFHRHKGRNTAHYQHCSVDFYFQTLFAPQQSKP